ncbi:MerR family transcriptional regulator [Actinoplanes aureus]|uniref:MerR family transcriptional regulator n=1 Tax=Actinoplanes aureus TaxID=2792083 RepID=UPI001E64C4CD|nr:MerR family transcriptional regulator [Actinoplanes aureus]
MAQLAERSGIAVPTIKYYLRVGLLPPGRATARNQAEYTDRHLRRLRLVDTLIGVGGFAVTAARAVLAAVDDVRLPAAELVGTVLTAAPAAGRARGVDDGDLRTAELVVTAAVGDRHRTPAAEARLLDSLIEACAVAEMLGVVELGAALEQYVAAARMCAACDEKVLLAYAAHRNLAPEERDPAVREAVVIVLVLGAVLRSALTGLAQQDVLSPLLAGAAGLPDAG